MWKKFAVAKQADRSQLLFTKANNTRARLTFAGSGYTVEVDTSGNGNFVVVP